MLLSLAKGPEEASGKLKFVQGNEGGPRYQFLCHRDASWSLLPSRRWQHRPRFGVAEWPTLMGSGTLLQWAHRGLPLGICKDPPHLPAPWEWV